MSIPAYLSDFVTYVTKHLPLIICNRLESNITDLVILP